MTHNLIEILSNSVHPKIGIVSLPLNLTNTIIVKKFDFFSMLDLKNNEKRAKQYLA